MFTRHLLPLPPTPPTPGGTFQFLRPWCLPVPFPPSPTAWLPARPCGLHLPVHQNQTSTRTPCPPTYLKPYPLSLHSRADPCPHPSVPTCPTACPFPQATSPLEAKVRTQQWPSSSPQQLLGPCPAHSSSCAPLALSSSLTLRGTPGPGSPPAWHLHTALVNTVALWAGFWFVLYGGT